jgi:hypothetical protein
MTDNTYNGWRNRETWLVNIWFGDMFTETAQEGDKWDADAIKDYIEEYVSEECNGLGGFVGDLIDLSQIDWDTLAEHINEDFEAE